MNPIPRAETIAAVLEACDGHYGRVCEEQPAPDGRPMARVVYRPPAPLEPIRIERPQYRRETRTCECCWMREFTVPRTSTRQFCDECRPRVQGGTAPPAPDVRCPFCPGTFRVDIDDNAVTHSPGKCSVFVNAHGGASFLRKAALRGARAVAPAPARQETP